MSLKEKIDNIVSNNSGNHEKEAELKKLLTDVAPDTHDEVDLIWFRNYFWKRQLTRPETVVVLQVIADELDRRSLGRERENSERVAAESMRLNKQSNRFALWALIIALASFGVAVAGLILAQAH